VLNDPTQPLEKTDALPHLASLQFPFLAGTVLDCEILVPGKDSATTAGTVNRKDTNGDSRRVKMFVFDVIPYYRDVDLSDMKLYTRMTTWQKSNLKLIRIMSNSCRLRSVPLKNESCTKLY
jgi:hypothetical protein